MLLEPTKVCAMPTMVPARGLPVVVRVKVKVRVRVRVRVRDGACEGGLAVVVGRVLGDVAGELRHLVRVRVRA